MLSKRVASTNLLTEFDRILPSKIETIGLMKNIMTGIT
jgi:hypothetical protein